MYHIFFLHQGEKENTFVLKAPLTGFLRTPAEVLLNNAEEEEEEEEEEEAAAATGTADTCWFPEVSLDWLSRAAQSANGLVGAVSFFRFGARGSCFVFVRLLQRSHAFDFRAFSFDFRRRPFLLSVGHVLPIFTEFYRVCLGLSLRSPCFT